MLKTETDNNFENEKKVCSNCGAVAGKNDTYCKKCYYEFKSDEEENLQVIEGIDNSTVREFVDKNYDYYREKFVRSGDKKFFIQFNLCAFLFGVHWFFYRKMYKVAIIYSAALILLSVLATVVIPVVHRQDIKHYEVVREVYQELIKSDKAYYDYVDENGYGHVEKTPEFAKVSEDYGNLQKKLRNTWLWTMAIGNLFNFGFRLFANCIYKRHIITHAEYDEGGTSFGAVVIGHFATRALDTATTYLLIFIPIVAKWSSILLDIIF